MQQDKAGEVVTSYYGIDLHKDQITWHCIHKTGNGETVRENGKISTDRVHEELVPMLTVNDSYLIVEASGSSFFSTAWWKHIVKKHSLLILLPFGNCT